MYPHRFGLEKTTFLLAVVTAAGACDALDDLTVPDTDSAVVESARVASSARGTVTVCHRSGGAAGYVPIAVADQALPAHERHGDAPVGGSVPGESGMVFDASCAPVPSLRLLAPAPGAVLDNGCSHAHDLMEWAFDWSDVPGAERYHLFVIAATAEFPVINRDYLSASEYRLVSYGYIIERHRLGWTWRVRAYVDGQWGEWTEERVFDLEPLNTDCS